MIRDYTEAVYQDLLGTIESIEAQEQSWLIDKLGDLIFAAGKWVGILDLENGITSTQTYHRSVLDMHDTTKAELDRIFTDVWNQEYFYDSCLTKMIDIADEYNTALNSIDTLIDPNMDLTADDIRGIGNGIIRNIKNAYVKLDEQFDMQLDIRSKQIAVKAAKGFVKDLVKGVANIIGIMKDAVTLNPIGAICKGWKEINDFEALLYDLGALLLVGIGAVGLTDNHDRYNILVKEADEYYQTESLADVFENEGLDGIAHACKGIDMTADYLGLIGLFDTQTADPNAVKNPIVQRILKNDKIADVIKTVTTVCTSEDPIQELCESLLTKPKFGEGIDKFKHLLEDAFETFVTEVS